MLATELQASELTPSELQQIQSEFDLNKTKFETAANNVTSATVIRKEQSVSGAAADLADYQTKMDTALQWFLMQNARLQQSLTASSSGTNTFTTEFLTKQKEMEELRTKVREAREIQQLRQEQVGSLDAREEANFHTSWMLSRPLKEQSRTGLIVAAGAFAFLALVGGYYAVQLYRDTPGFFSGGRRKGRYSS